MSDKAERWNEIKIDYSELCSRSDSQLFDLVYQGVKKFISDRDGLYEGLSYDGILIYEEVYERIYWTTPQHNFVLPPELRSGELRPKELASEEVKSEKLQSKFIKFDRIDQHFPFSVISMMKYYTGDDLGNYTKNIKTGSDAILGWTNFILKEQDRYNNSCDIDKASGRRNLESPPDDCYTCCYCLSSYHTDRNPYAYGVADKIKDLDVSWINPKFILCSSCYEFPFGVSWSDFNLVTLPDFAFSVYNLLTTYFAKDLVFIIRDYLRPIFIMDKHCPTKILDVDGNYVEHYLGAKVIDTSVMTEWLCIFYYDANENSKSLFMKSPEAWFMNCNPDSKFYGYVFMFNGGDGQYEPVHIVNLI